jgi:hypothetical protein
MSDDDKRSDFPCPMIIRPFAPYKSVITGQEISDRSGRREEVARAADRGLVPFERIDGRPAGLINEEFAKRGGRQVSEEAKEWADNKRAAQKVKTDSEGNILSD